MSGPYAWADVKPREAAPRLLQTIVLGNTMAAGADFERAYALKYEREAVGHRRAVQTVLSALFSGVDEVLPADAEVTTRRYPVSDYLTECGKEAQGLLFQACHKAQQGDNHEAAAALRRFIERVARDYADDHEGAFE